MTEERTGHHLVTNGNKDYKWGG